MLIEGNHTGEINTGTRIDTGGGTYVGGNVQVGRDFIGRDKISLGFSPDDLETLFANLITTIQQETADEQQNVALEEVEELKAEVAKGDQADDNKLAKILDGLVSLVPGAIGSVVKLFANPILEDLVGPVTRFVLDKLKSK